MLSLLLDRAEVVLMAAQTPWTDWDSEAGTGKRQDGLTQLLRAAVGIAFVHDLDLDFFSLRSRMLKPFRLCKILGMASLQPPGRRLPRGPRRFLDHRHVPGNGFCHCLFYGKREDGKRLYQLAS